MKSSHDAFLFSNTSLIHTTRPSNLPPWPMSRILSSFCLLSPRSFSPRSELPQLNSSLALVPLILRRTLSRFARKRGCQNSRVLDLLPQCLAGRLIVASSASKWVSERILIQRLNYPVLCLISPFHLFFSCIVQDFTMWPRWNLSTSLPPK